MVYILHICTVAAEVYMQCVDLVYVCVCVCISIHDIVCTSNAIMHAGYVVYLCMAVQTVLTLHSGAGHVVS